MITASELNPKQHKLTKEQAKNQDVLLYKMCVFRFIYGKPMVGTSGVRSMDEHIDIYRRKGVDLENIPMGSKHLAGAAWDVLDEDGSLMSFCIGNEHILKRIGLWVEQGTKGWVHFQALPYGSWSKEKTMFFLP